MTDKATFVQQARNYELIRTNTKLPLKSGLCLAGFHEGSKPVSREGIGIKTCGNYQLCPCTCHADIDELFELSGKVREPVSNPLYKPIITHYSPSVISAPGLLGNEEIDIQPGVAVSPAPGVVPGEIPKEYKETPTGRAARGQLELFTKQAVDEWVIENYVSNTPSTKQIPCTINYVSQRIAEMQGITAPLAGGINSVFLRWTAQGIAKIAYHPTRFLSYTEDAVEYGMDYMRDRAKRENR